MIKYIAEVGFRECVGAALEWEHIHILATDADHAYSRIKAAYSTAVIVQNIIELERYMEMKQFDVSAD